MSVNESGSHPYNEKADLVSRKNTENKATREPLPNGGDSAVKAENTTARTMIARIGQAQLSSDSNSPWTISLQSMQARYLFPEVDLREFVFPQHTLSCLCHRSVSVGVPFHRQNSLS
jgi:hypothetical protein